MTEDPQKYEALLAGHYSDSNHFVYELLQNAEDEKANKVVIEYYEDRLVFYHDGEPFDEADVKGVSSMLMGTKDKEDAQTIGRFGMGFKSVFKYTYQPEIYSDDEAFKITSYLLPVAITEGWDFEKEKQNVVCKLSDTRSFMPFVKADHLTKIIIPFKKYGRNGELESVPGDDVLKKLLELDGEILLFLTHIHNLYWVNKENGDFAQITLSQDEKDEKLITCRIEGTEYDGKEDISKYLKFKEVFNHPEMKGAEVSVAYKLNSRGDNVNEVEDSDIWVYFPTRDNADLPFLIHGSFETAVSREKLMTPSSFNSDLFDKLGDLIATSMEELAERKLITQVFLRRIVLAAFEDEESNETIPGLKEKITKAFIEKGLVPNRNGEYKNPSELKLPVPFRMADFIDKPLISKAFVEGLDFVAFNNEREANFTTYFNWLVQDLGIGLYKLSNLAKDLSNIPETKIGNSGEIFDSLKEFYDFLSDNREAIYQTNLSYTRSGSYEAAIRQDIKHAWEELRKAPIILNRLNKLVPAQVDGKPSIYLAASSEYKSVMQSALVHTGIATTFGKVLSEGFLVQEFNNFQYIKEKVIKKYIDIDEQLGFADHDNFADEYVEDLKQIFSLIEQTGDVAGVREMLRDAYIIKVKPTPEDDGGKFSRPRECYAPKSSEGIDLEIYYAPVPYEDTEEDELDNPDNWYDFNVFAIDSEFYEENGIAISSLVKLGLITSPVHDGIRSQDGVGDGHWIAIGEYCPNISIDELEDNILFIEQYPDMELAKKKSVEVLKLLLAIANKLQGKKKFRKNNPYTSELRNTSILTYTIRPGKWLFDKDMRNGAPTDLSKYDLNPALYGPVEADKARYKILGFKEKEVDGAEETLQKAQALNKSDKMRLLNWLAKDLGKEVSDPGRDDDWGDEDDNQSFFDPTQWMDEEFPTNRVRNLDYLTRHVREQFYCADPTTYRKVWRQIRVSKNTKADRSYAIGMYTNSNNTKICQICKKPVAFIEVDQLANFGIEMPQLNLCLCRECSAKYRAIRDVNKDEFKNNLRRALLSIEADEEADDYSIECNQDVTIHFTQTHIAEIQEILRLLNEYGTPSEDADELYDEEPAKIVSMPAEEETRVVADSMRRFANIDLSPSIVADLDAREEARKQEPKASNEGIAVEGCIITYRKKFAGDEEVNNVLQPSKFPLHKAFLGHKVGDVIVFMSKQYEIVDIINS